MTVMMRVLKVETGLCLDMRCKQKLLSKYCNDFHSLGYGYHCGHQGCVLGILGGICVSEAWTKLETKS